MIDTDKYTGHTEGKWELQYDDSAIYGGYLSFGAQLDPVGALHPMSIVNAQLIADAPLLLAEVKRLRKEVKRLRKELKEAEDVIQIALDLTSDDEGSQFAFKAMADAKKVFEDFLEVIK